MRIVNTNNLRVEQLGKNEYLTWTSIIFFSFVPKVIFKLNDRGKVKSTKVIGFTKSLILNYLFVLGIFLIYLYLEGSDLSRISDFMPLLLGILLFLVLTNLIVIRTTKRIVKRQIE